ncbi:MAG: molybdopterin-dependent oxidoreductase [Pseudomonadota bacterium]|nr:molybdopterin-dependent oxidoreductase [Pseudomonadota bacterium]
MTLSRRQWLGTSAAAAGLAATTLELAPLKQALASNAEAEAKAAEQALKTFTGTRPHADHYGAIQARIENGRFVGATPGKSDMRPNPMSTEGMLARTYDKSRIKGPTVRKSYLDAVLAGQDMKARRPELRGQDEWVQVSWDVALNLTAKAILDTIENHGNEGLFSSSYGGWSHGGIFRPNVLQGRFFNLLGGTSFTTSNYSAGTALVLMPFLMGDMEAFSPQTSWEVMRDHCELMVFVGADPDKNNRIEFTAADHEMEVRWDEIKKAGCQFISIDPQVTPTAEKLGAEWVRIVPNTDTALFLAMSQYLVSQNRHNQAFIDKYTVGFDKFLAYLDGKDADGTPPKTPEWAAQITGIPAGKIRALAEQMASKRTQIAGSWAIQRGQHGEMPYWAIMNFACILGNIGLPGQGIGFSWHFGGGGTVRSGGRPPTGMSQGRNPIKKICPASRISEMLLNPGKEFSYDGHQHTYPKVKLIYNAGNNFFSHQQDLNELARAMQTVDTVIVQDCWWNGSARWADIVLPATTTVERNDITSSGFYSLNKIYAMRQLVAPVGDVLDDFEIFRRLAVMFGVEYAFTEGKTQMDYVKQAYAGSSAAKVMPFEQFWDEGVVHVPVPEANRQWTRHGEFRADPVKHKLHTASGKLEMYCEAIDKFKIADCPPIPKWIEPAEYLGNAKKGELHVVSPHPYYRLHSQMDNAEPLRKRYKVRGREPVLISRKDAAERGIRNGDLVELHNDRGSVLAGAVVTDKIMPGVLSLYEGAWPQLDSKGRCNNGQVNFITSSRRTSGLSQACAANTCLARLRKAEGVDTGGTKAFDQPAITVRADLKLDEKFAGLDRAVALREKSMSAMLPGEKLYYQRCTVCHGPREPGAYNARQWQGITESMFPRTGMDEKERAQVMDYLLKNAKK